MKLPLLLSAVVTSTLAAAFSAYGQISPPNVPPTGAYQPIPNYIGTNAGLQFRTAINDRFSGASPISPKLAIVSYASLPAEQDGLLIYCSDCDRAIPCAAGGNGAWAFGAQGQWQCAAPGNTNLSGDAVGPSASNLVTATHLSAPLPKAQGGTGDSQGADLSSYNGTVSIAGSGGIVGLQNSNNGQINLAANLNLLCTGASAPFPFCTGSHTGTFTPAACDGSTDDSAAFAGAISAASVLGQSVIIPCGRTCAVDHLLVDNVASVRVRGCGYALAGAQTGSRIKLTGTGGGACGLGSNGLIRVFNSGTPGFTHDITFDGIDFVAGNSGAGGSCMVNVSSVSSNGPNNISFARSHFVTSGISSGAGLLGVYLGNTYNTNIPLFAYDSFGGYFNQWIDYPATSTYLNNEEIAQNNFQPIVTPANAMFQIDGPFNGLWFDKNNIEQYGGVVTGALPSPNVLRTTNANGQNFRWVSNQQFDGPSPLPWLPGTAYVAAPSAPSGSQNTCVIPTSIFRNLGGACTTQSTAPGPYLAPLYLGATITDGSCGWTVEGESTASCNTVARWAANTAKTANDCLASENRLSDPNMYCATVAGTSGTSQPNWSGCTTPGCTLTDGTVTWQWVGDGASLALAEPIKAVIDGNTIHSGAVGVELRDGAANPSVTVTNNITGNLAAFALSDLMHSYIAASSLKVDGNIFGSAGNGPLIEMSIGDDVHTTEGVKIGKNSFPTSYIYAVLHTASHGSLDFDSTSLNPGNVVNRGGCGSWFIPNLSSTDTACFGAALATFAGKIQGNGGLTVGSGQTALFNGVIEHGQKAYTESGGGTVTADLSLGDPSITISDANGWSLAFSNGGSSYWFTVFLVTSAGVTGGTITPGSGIKFDSSVAAPAAGKTRICSGRSYAASNMFVGACSGDM